MAHHSNLCLQCGNVASYKADGETICEPCLSGLLKSKAISIQITNMEDNLVSLKVCPGCNSTVEDIKKVGLLACPSCYSSFREEIQAKA